MAKVKKVWTEKPCKCGRMPKVCQWTDTKRPNATWIECECGMVTKSFYSKDPQTAKDNAIKTWNKTSRRRNIKKGLRSCEKCGSGEVHIHKFQTPGWQPSFMVFCDGCGLCTEEIDNDGNLRTEKQAKELWNG